MKVISLTLTCRISNTCAAIGIFDGVHRGHQYLIKKMLARAKALKLKSMVITFFPHPAHVLRPDVHLPYVVSLKERMRLLEELGVDLCVVVRFTKRFAQIEPERFISQVLVGQLGVKALYVGDDFHFGKDRGGDVPLFKEMSRKYGYEMHGVKALLQDGEPISSTRIRKMLIKGDVSSAHRLLGRYFYCGGKVVRGNGRGKGFGFPTANVEYDNDIMPNKGVYAVYVLIKNKIYPAVANFGTRPTINKKVTKPLLEAHLFDFNRDLYGLDVTVQFIKKIREERAFSSIQELTLQISRDVRVARALLKKI